MLQVNGINIKLIRVSPTTTPQALVEEIQEFWKMYNSPVFIEMPNQPLRHIEAFYRPDSFSVLNRLRREYNTPIIFIIPAGVRLMNEAKRSGFPVYSALSEGVEALTQEPFPVSRSQSGPISHDGLTTKSGPIFQNNPISQRSLTSQSGPISQSGFVSHYTHTSNSSLPPLNNTTKVHLPSYMSNPPSWTGLPLQDGHTALDSKSPLSTTPLFDRPQYKADVVEPPVYQPVHDFADERAYNGSSLPTRAFGDTASASFIGKNTPHRPIYRRPAFLVTLVVLICLLLAGSFLIALNRPNVKQTHTALPTTHAVTATAMPLAPLHTIGIEKASDGEYIGLSDGSYAFDINRPDGATKQQAADKLRAGDVGTALSLWHDAVTRDTNDAEALIYLENQRVISSGNPYVTLVVGTMDTGTYVSLGRDDLQGAYVAQKEYNDGHTLSGNVLVRLLIASTGDDKAYADIVAKQIVYTAKSDPSIVGVMGWPYSSRTLNVIQTLTDAHIPIVSQMASSVLLTGVSPYFFRIVPPDSTQAKTGAIFTENVLHAKSAALFIDPSDAYSDSIGNAFKQQFEQDGNHVVATEHYTVGKPATVISTLQDALLHAPDVIYFAGLADDANALLAHLPTEGQFSQIKVVGGDGLYSIGSYSNDAVVQKNFHRLCFSAFAYADTWGYLGAKTEPSFFTDYPTFFDPNQQHGGGSYGYNRADGDVILSYDAIVVLLTAYQRVLSTQSGATNITVTPTELRDALAAITNTNAVQGVTGRIAFGSIKRLSCSLSLKQGIFSYNPYRDNSSNRKEGRDRFSESFLRRFGQGRLARLSFLGSMGAEDALKRSLRLKRRSPCRNLIWGNYNHWVLL